MKKLIIILSISLITITAISQAKFSVPSLTDLQKYQMAATQWNGACFIQISYAKSLGKSVEETAQYTAEQMKTTWTVGGGFDRFVYNILSFMVSMVPDGSVQIIEQKHNELTYKVTGFYPDLKEGGLIFNVTYLEYIRFWEVTFSKLADYMGSKYSQKDTDDGLIVTIKKK